MIKKQNGRITVYNRYVIRNGKPEYMVAKLIEHSWWLNDFVGGVCLDIYNEKKPVRIAWIGDYAQTFLKRYGKKEFNGLNQQHIYRMTRRCWDCEGIAVQENDFTLDGLFLINHSKNQYLDCNEYYKNSVMPGEWCFHPLPLLTCIGNTGEDKIFAKDSTNDYIGAWAWDEISITEKPIKNYTEIMPVFKV